MCMYVCLPVFLISSSSRSQKNHLVISFCHLCVACIGSTCIALTPWTRVVLLAQSLHLLKLKKSVIVDVTEEMSSFCICCGAQTCSRLSIDFLLSLESICKLHLDISRACLCNVILALTPVPSFPTPPHHLRHTKCPAKDH